MITNEEMLLVITLLTQPLDAQLCAGGLCISESYDSLNVPNGTVQLYIELHPWSPVVLINVDDMMSTLTLDLSLNLKWHDPGLTSKGIIWPPRKIPDEISKRLWRPEIGMSSMKTAHIKKFNEELSGFYISKEPEESSFEGNNSINFFQALNIDLWCDMDFYDFPYDKHVSTDL